ncbi:glycosyl hydrolase family 18 protein [Brevibacillus dissolubilis]|uniref:glycosyl hydrolase family 18 protein n=1 Tax=Brevibacillus dissolubilis TaxID=1844116 RepID=UPI0021003399|nr:glycosyl hydrolase family 18 protein [Brevibacillus dissolubilis]
MKQYSKFLFFSLLSLMLVASSLPTADAAKLKPPTTSTTTPTAYTATTKSILGYYVVYYTGDKTSYNSLYNYNSYLNEVSTMTFDVTTTGAIAGTVPADGVSLANSKGVKAYAAVSNHGAGGAFDKDLARKVITDPVVRQTTINNILNLVKNNNYRGVNIDFEDMYASDRPSYTQFISELATTMRANGFSTIVSVMAKTSDSPTSAWVGTFDYAALGQAADKIQVMTYDENGPWGAPGPVASKPWVEKVIQYTVSQIPSTKVLIGLPAYGYDWNTTAGTGKAVTWKSMPNLISSTGATPQWDATAQSPYFTYKATDGTSHTVWYENSESIKVKTKLVNQYNLGGVSVWRMGLEDLSFWQAVTTGLSQ